MCLRNTSSEGNFDSQTLHERTLVERALVSSAATDSHPLSWLHETGHLHIGKLFVELEALRLWIIDLPLIDIPQQCV